MAEPRKRGGVENAWEVEASVTFTFRTPTDDADEVENEVIERLYDQFGKDCRDVVVISVAFEDVVNAVVSG